MVTDIVLEALGIRLRSERVRLGHAQREFGALVGTNRQSQLNYENGRTAPNAEYLYRIAEHGADIGYILTGHRTDGSLGWEETQIFEMFQMLSAREREAVFSLMSVLTGRIIEASDLPKRAHLPEHPSLQNQRQTYRSGPDAKD